MNDENLTLEELNDPERRKKEFDEVMQESFRLGQKMAEERRKYHRHQMLRFPIRLVFFQAMLLIKLFKWTYDDKD